MIFNTHLVYAWEIYKDGREAAAALHRETWPKLPPPLASESLGYLPWKAEDDWSGEFDVFRHKGEKLTYRRDGTVRWQDSTFDNPRIAIASIDSYCGAKTWRWPPSPRQQL